VGNYTYVSDVLFFGHEFEDFACLSKPRQGRDGPNNLLFLKRPPYKNVVLSGDMSKPKPNLVYLCFIYMSYSCKNRKAPLAWHAVQNKRANRPPRNGIFKTETLIGEV
jgi:hypothetical protein